MAEVDVGNVRHEHRLVRVETIDIRDGGHHVARRQRGEPTEPIRMNRDDPGDAVVHPGGLARQHRARLVRRRADARRRHREPRALDVQPSMVRSDRSGVHRGKRGPVTLLTLAERIASR